MDLSKNWIYLKIIDWCFTIVLVVVHKYAPLKEIAVSFVLSENTIALTNKNKALGNNKLGTIKIIETRRYQVKMRDI